MTWPVSTPIASTPEGATDGAPSGQALLIGLVLALLLPRAHSRPLPLRALLRALGRSLLAVPQAYLEALRLIVGREPVEEEISEATTDGTIPLLVFLDVFRITLTPFTIVLGLEDGGRRYRIHALTPGRAGGPPR